MTPGPDHICKSNNGVSLSLFILISAFVIIVLSTVDYYTSLIWAAPPKVNTEIRYIVTIFAIGTLFVYTYCRHTDLT